MMGGLYSRLAWAFAIGLVLFHVVSGGFHAHDALVQQAANFAKAQIDRVRLIDELTAADSELLARLSTDDFVLAGASTAPVQPARPWMHKEEVHQLVDPHLRKLGLTETQARFWFRFDRSGPRLVLALQRDLTQKPQQVADTPQWLVADVRAETASWRPHLVGLLRTTVFALVILAGVLWATRRATRILPLLATAAEKIGNFGATEPLPITGPKEVRRVSKAFNLMQERLRAHERERGAMLGAFSHDIRTLVTRLTLRLEPLVVDADRSKLEADLAGITHIVDEALAYSRDEVSDEPRVKIELVSLLQTLIDDMPNAEIRPQSLEDRAKVTLIGQPQGLRRALLNLLNNAVLYGERAQVSWTLTQDQVVLDIADDGPGIPLQEQERVLEPYVRLEGSRNRATGGSGLGLAIVHNVIRRHEGSLSFKRDDAGFHVRLALPLGL